MLFCGATFHFVDWGALQHNYIFYIALVSKVHGALLFIVLII